MNVILQEGAMERWQRKGAELFLMHSPCLINLDIQNPRKTKPILRSMELRDLKTK
jgi:hypothetical protein